MHKSSTTRFSLGARRLTRQEESEVKLQFTEREKRLLSIKNSQDGSPMAAYRSTETLALLPKQLHKTFNQRMGSEHHFKPKPGLNEYIIQELLGTGMRDTAYSSAKKSSLDQSESLPALTKKSDKPFVPKGSYNSSYKAARRL
jgi:hypothetical protein